MNEFSVSDLTLGIVAANRSPQIVDRLLAGSTRTAKLLGITNIKTIRVPGTLELPLGAKYLAETNTVDMIACLGSIKRGDTNNYDLITNTSIGAVMGIQISTGIPITWGVAGVEYDQQSIFRSALVRSDPDDKNLGEEAVQAAIEMTLLKKELDPNFKPISKSTN